MQPRLIYLVATASIRVACEQPCEQPRKTDFAVSVKRGEQIVGHVPGEQKSFASPEAWRVSNV